MMHCAEVTGHNSARAGRLLCHSGLYKTVAEKDIRCGLQACALPPAMGRPNGEESMHCL